jgi:hypothetical protein
MSYARWSNSCWYAFYNVNGCLSLWYSMDKTFDIPVEDVQEILDRDAPERVAVIMEIYACAESEAEEAIKYMEMFLEDYDPKDTEEYNREVKELMDKWEGMKDES